MNKLARIFAFLFFLILPASAHAQMVMVNVLPDKVSIAAENINRCQSGAAGHLVVATGQTVTWSDGQVFDCVEVETGATYKTPRTGNPTLRVTTLIVMPGGALDVGTPTDPITGHPTIEVRNVPIDPADVDQWGNGIVVFGNFTANGPKRVKACELAFDVFSMATSFVVNCDPTGWQVGDNLQVLGSVSDTPYSGRPGNVCSSALPCGETPEPVVSVTSISGHTITISAPLVHDHRTVFGQDGRVGVHPKVVNQTRSIRFTSENAQGTPGHIALVGQGACWDIEGAQFDNLGRTTDNPLDPVNNHIGRYMLHFHHANGAPCAIGRKTIDNVYLGTGPGKWGEVVHGTHDSVHQDNVGGYFKGAAFVTEDGYEVRNWYQSNIGYLNRAPLVFDTNGQPTNLSARTNLLNSQPGTEGSCFWQHGVQNYYDGNECWGNNVGFNLFNFQATNNVGFAKNGQFPSMVDGPLDTNFIPPYIGQGPPYLFDHTTVVANRYIGLDVWGVEDFDANGGLKPTIPVLNHVTSVNDYLGVFVNQSDFFSELYLNNAVIIGSFPTAGNDGDIPYAGSCVFTTTGYTSPFIIDNSYISGCPIAMVGIANSGATVSNSTIQGAIGWYIDVRVGDPFVPTMFSFTNVSWLPYGNYSHRFIVDTTGTLWDGSTPIPAPFNGSAPPPPPPPVEEWSTWILQHSSFGNLRACPDATGVGCVAIMKQ